MQYARLFAYTCTFLLSSVSGFASSQAWTESSYHLHDKHYHVADEFNIWSGTGSYISVESVFIGRFKVTGSASSAPSWRSPFATLCDNPLPISEEWEGTLSSTNELVNFVSYYFRGPHDMETCSRNGQSGHSAGDCGYSNNINSFTDGSTTLTRYLEGDGM